MSAPKEALSSLLAETLQVTTTRFEALHGGCVAQVYKVGLVTPNPLDCREVVVKYDPSAAGTLDIEGRMLQYLGEQTALPVPPIYFASSQLLVMGFLPGSNHFSPKAQQHAGHLIAQLHQITAPSFGFEETTLIGGLPQPNPQHDTWLELFRETRIRQTARLAYQENVLPTKLLHRLETFADQAEQWLAEPERPALLHGDLWGGNILASSEKITGLVDPALYFGHPEIELAFTTLFGTFEAPFFQSYQEIQPIAPGFFESRKELYNLYPRLVHVRLFGRGYLAGIDETLRRIGL